MTMHTVGTDGTSWHERLLITIVGPSSRVDVRLRPEATVGELLPRLVDIVVDSEFLHDATASWNLLTMTGQPLASQRTLSESDVHDGDMLYLEPDETTEIPAQRLVRLGDVADATVWDDADRSAWLTGFAAVSVVGCAAGVALTGQRYSGIDALAFAAGIVLTFGVGAILRRRPRGSGWLPVPPLALLAVGAWHLAFATHTAPAAAAFAGLAVLVACAALVLAARDAAPLAAGVVALVAPAVLILAVVASVGSTVTVAAAFAASLWCLGLDAAPRVAVFVSRADRLDPQTAVYDAATTSGADLDEALARARRFLVAVIGGVSLGIAACWAMLAVAGGWPNIVLTTATTIFVALRARRHRRAAEVGLLVTTALAGVIALLVGVVGSFASRHGFAEEVVGGVIVLVVLAAVTGEIASLPRASLGTQLLMQRLVFVLRLSLLPLSLWAAGIYEHVAAGSAHITHHL